MPGSQIPFHRQNLPLLILSDQVCLSLPDVWLLIDASLLLTNIWPFLTNQSLKGPIIHRAKTDTNTILGCHLSKTMFSSPGTGLLHIFHQGHIPSARNILLQSHKKKVWSTESAALYKGFIYCIFTHSVRSNIKIPISSAILAALSDTDNKVQGTEYVLLGILHKIFNNGWANISVRASYVAGRIQIPQAMIRLPHSVEPFTHKRGCLITHNLLPATHSNRNICTTIFQVWAFVFLMLQNKYFRIFAS